MKQKLMSGMRPTGKLHLGHYIGVLSNWVNLQKDYDCFWGIADLHALTTKYDNTEDLQQNIIDVVLDWLSCGIDPNKSTIYVQSQIPQVCQLHVLLSMITPQNWVERDPTLKDMAKILRNKSENTSSVSYGLMGYPVLMTTDILIFNAQYVPVGIDQVAHIEITRDIARRFNNLYNTDFFIEPKPLLTHVPMLLGVDGQKMGKSFNNDIKISDDDKTTEEKILKAITDPSRMKKTDCGNIENCQVAFKYYEAFAKDNPELLNQVKEECHSAKIGCRDCKKRLACLINEKFAPIRQKRNELSKNIDELKQIIDEGNKKVQIENQKVLDKVNEIMHMYK